jgi:hypothetical protein
MLRPIALGGGCRLEVGLPVGRWRRCGERRRRRPVPRRQRIRPTIRPPPLLRNLLARGRGPIGGPLIYQRLYLLVGRRPCQCSRSGPAAARSRWRICPPPRRRRYAPRRVWSLPSRHLRLPCGSRRTGGVSRPGGGSRRWSFTRLGAAGAPRRRTRHSSGSPDGTRIDDEQRPASKEALPSKRFAGPEPGGALRLRGIGPGQAQLLLDPVRGHQGLNHAGLGSPCRTMSFVCR